MPNRRVPVEPDPLWCEVYHCRLARGWSIEELARRSGVSADLIGRAELGLQCTKVEALRAALEALGLELTALHMRCR